MLRSCMTLHVPPYSALSFSLGMQREREREREGGREGERERERERGREREREREREIGGEGERDRQRETDREMLWSWLCVALRGSHTLSCVTDFYLCSSSEQPAVDMWIVTLRDTQPQTMSITEDTRWEVTVEILSRVEEYGSPWRLKSQHSFDKMVKAIPEGK